MDPAWTEVRRVCVTAQLLDQQLRAASTSTHFGFVLDTIALSLEIYVVSYCQDLINCVLPLLTISHLDFAPLCRLSELFSVVLRVNTLPASDRIWYPRRLCWVLPSG